MKFAVVVLSLILSGSALAAQVPQPSTSYDLFVMPGLDVDHPGLIPRVNLNIGIGHSFAALSKIRVGDEPTFAYTYENAGSHGFFHSNNGAHTETVGLMKNFTLSKNFGSYLWPQAGLTTVTGYRKPLNRAYYAGSGGLVYHLSRHQGIWLQETYNKVETTPWYTSTNIGYVLSW